MCCTYNKSNAMVLRTDELVSSCPSGWTWELLKLNLVSDQVALPAAACSCLPAGGNADLVLNQLLKHTAVQSRFSANMVALVGATPLTLTLKNFLQHFLSFRSVEEHGCIFCITVLCLDLGQSL